MIYLSKGGAGADSDHTWIRPCISGMNKSHRITSQWITLHISQVHLQLYVKKKNRGAYRNLQAAGHTSCK